MKRYVFHPEADKEYVEAAIYYARISPQLGGRFYDEIEHLIRDICQDPERFRQFDPPAQRHLSTVFPYSIVYLNQPDYVWIIAIMHAKRRPAYWRERLA